MRYVLRSASAVPYEYASTSATMAPPLRRVDGSEYAAARSVAPRPIGMDGGAAGARGLMN
jgi:hypothetical protein